MSDPKSSDSPQVKLNHEWLRALDTRDIDRIAKCLHRDYRNIMYPRSLGKPEQTKEEWLEDLAGRFSFWIERKLTVHSITNVPGKVIFHGTNTFKTPVGDITRESILIKHIVTDEDGSLKVKLGEEFTDSKAYLDAAEAIAVARAKGQ